MKKLFLLTFVFTLLCTWSMAGADTSPNLSTSSDNAAVEKVVNKDIETARLEKDALAQEALEALPDVGPATSLMSEGFLPSPTVTLVPEKAPYNGVINAPDENVILVGGEDCANATAIIAIPYNDAGTTSGYADDYDAVCPSSSTSPDVVYSYTPEVNMGLTISTCNSSYDTKVFVYENDCATDPIACNDDADFCESSPYAARIECVEVFAGNTYFIVIDGWGGEFGDYVLEITECTPPTGACCVEFDCTMTTEATCNNAGGNWYAGEDCATFECPTVPDNDLCENPEQVTGPYPVNVCGTNVNATIDCPGVLDWYTVWYEIELPYAVNNLEITICQQVETVNTTVGIVLAECDCSYIVRDGGLEFIVCENTFTGYNQIWSNLPGPGTVLYPAWIADGNTLEPLAFCLDIDVTEPTEPIGACCVEEECIGTMNEADCLTACGTWYEGEDCDLGFECPSGAGCLTQLPNQVNGIFSDANCGLCGTGIQVLADQMVLSSATDIYSLTWWGGWYPSNVPTGETNFTIMFKDDAGGVPGTALYTLTGQAPTLTDTGMDLFGVDEYHHFLDLTAEGITVGPGVIFIEIYITTTNDDSYFWETGDLDPANGIIGQAWSPTLPEEPWNYDTETDLALIVDGNCEGGGPVDDIITVEIFTDAYPGETTWEVIDNATQEVYASGDPDVVNSLHTYTVCVPTTGCYDFVIYDSYGDGICCAYGDGYYNVFFNGDLVGSGGEFGDSETTPDIGNGCAPCVVECPPEAVQELEACGDDTNGGCNMEVPTWEPIQCGTIVCGTTWAEGDSRDTDWYELVLATPQVVTVSIEADYPVAIFILSYDCNPTVFIETGETDPCTPFSISATLDAGTYTIWTGPGTGAVPIYNGIPCDGSGDYTNNYVLEVTCVDAPLAACCDAGLVCIGDMNQFDCAAVFGGWFEDETCDDFTCILFQQQGLATTGNIPDVAVSNYGPLGDDATQGNTYNWSGMGAVNYAATFVMGNSPTAMFSEYNPGITDTYPFGLTGFLQMGDTYNPTADYDDGGVLGGITIDYCGHGFNASNPPAEADDIFVHSFTITNEGTEEVSNFYAGVYFDWDIDLDVEDIVSFDRSRNMMYQSHSDGSYHYGLCLINADDIGLTSLAAVSQWDYIYPTGTRPPGGWAMEHLYTIMSDGGDNIWDVQYPDMSSLISTGPHVLGAGESVVVNIAVIGGATVADMEAGADLAATLEIDPCPAGGGGGCGPYVVGDYNGSGAFNVADIISAFSKLKTGAPDAALLCECPEGDDPWAVAMDVNNSCAFNVADVITGFSKLKTGAPELVPCDLCPPDGSPRPGGDQPLIVPNLESKVKLSTGSGME